MRIEFLSEIAEEVKMYCNTEVNNLKNKYFVKGAWLFTLEKELSEEDFVKLAGGIDKLDIFRSFPFISLVLDEENKGLLVGHINSRFISAVMFSHGHSLWQTMEWKNK